MESNITRDHIALEAMKIIYSKTFFRSFKPVNRLKKLLGLSVNKQNYSSLNYKTIANEAYNLADAMIAERNKANNEV